MDKGQNTAKNNNIIIKKLALADVRKSLWDVINET